MKKLLMAVIIVISFLGSFNSIAQTTGDYRTVAGGAFNWSDATRWERWNGSSWIANPAEGYPGSSAGALTVTVLSSMTGTLTLDVSPANAISYLAIQNGTAATDLSLGSNNLTITNDVTIAASALLNAGSSTLTIGGNLTVTGTFTSGTSTVVMNGAIQTISSGTFYNLTIQSAAFTFGGAATITVNNNLTSTGASINVSTANTLIVGNNFAINSGSFVATNGTVSLNSNSPQSISIPSGSSFFSLSLSGTGIKTLLTDIDINGNLSITGSTAGLLNDGGFSMTVAGAWTMNSADPTNLFASSGTVTFDGAGAQTISNANASGTRIQFYNVVFAGGGTKTISDGDAAVVTNTATITSTLGLGTTSTGSTLTGTGATLILNGVLNLYKTNTSFPAFATLSIGSTSTVQYVTGTMDVIGTNTGSGLQIPYNNLTMSNAGTKTATGDLDVNGTLTVQTNGDILNLGDFSHTFSGNVTVSNTASIISGTLGTSTLDSDDANQTLTVTTSNNAQFHNLNITLSAPTATRTKTITNNIDVRGTFQVTNTGGDNARALYLTLGTSLITNVAGTGTAFIVGSNVMVQSSATGANFDSMINDYTTITLASDSYIRLYGASVTVPVLNGGASYGGLYLTTAGTKTAAGDLDILGDFVMQNTASLIFDDAGYSITVHGNFNSGNNTATYNQSVPGTSNLIFAGGDQNIGAAFAFAGGNLVGAGAVTVYRVLFTGSGTKTLSTTFTVSAGGDLTIDSDANIVTAQNFNFAGATWTNSSGGTFVQTANTTTFNGTGTQTIDNGVSSSYFNVFTINNASVGGVVLNSDIDIHSNLNFTLNTATLDATGRTVTVSGYWNRNAGTNFTSTGSTVIFDGNTQQNVVISGGNIFENIIFRNSGTKYLVSSGTTMQVNGYLTIEGGATLNSNSVTNLTVNGDWTNVGTFITGQTVTFGGTNQLIGGSTFATVVFGGSGTKTLNGNIVLSGALTINDNVTLDVSNNNYSISLAGIWTNTGTNGIFEARQGTVNFWGNGRTISPGTNVQTLANKNFYNLQVNLTAGQTLTVALDNPIDVDNDFTMITGNFITGSYTAGLKPFTVGGNFVNTGGGTFTNTGCQLIFDGDPTGASAVTFDLNGSNMTGPIRMNIGSTDTLKVVTGFTNSYSANGTNFTLELTSGIFYLNSKQIILSAFASGSSIQLTSSNATLYVNSDATLQIPSNGVITNAGGNISVIGTNGAIATVTRSGGAGGYTINQTSGSIAARYYLFDFLRTSGINITGGTIDATNNFSDGTFSNGQDGSVGSQYIGFNNLNLGAGISIDNVVFNTNQDFNVSRTAGSTGTVTFNDATGSKAGAGSESDPGALINWNYIAVYWDGGGDGTTWEDANNWSSNSVPISSQNVILGHTFIPGAYGPISINSSAVSNNLIIDNDGSAITLNIVTGGLSVSGNVNIRAGNTLSQASAASLNVASNWSNAGTFTANNGTVTFNGVSKDATIVSGGSAFYNLTFNGSGSIYTLASNAITVSGNLTITDGTLDVSSGNLGITVGGHWSNSGTGVFVYRAGTVTFNGSGVNQNITGGPFYNFTTSSAAGGATRTLLANIDINNQVNIGANTTLIGGTNTIYVGASTGTAWVKTGSFTANTSTVIFDGGNATIDNGSSTVTNFYNLTLGGTGTKTFSVVGGVGGNISNNVVVNSTVGAVDLGTGTFTVGGSFTLTGGTTLTVRQTTLPLSSLVLSSNSTVNYLSNSDQDIFATTYGNLTVGRVTAGQTPNKNITGTTIVTGNMNLNDAEVRLNLGSYSVSVAGNISVPTGAGANFNTGTSTLTHNGGGWNIDTDITKFYNLILAGTGTKTLFGNFEIQNDLTISANVTMTATSQGGTPYYFYRTGTGGTFTMASGSQLNWAIPYNATPIAGAAPFPDNFTTYNINSASTIQFYSTSAQTIPTVNQTPVSITYGNVNLYYSGNGLTTKTISGTTWNVAGNLTLNSTYTAGVLTEFVTLDATNKTLNIGGNFTINDGVVIMTSGSTFNFNGTNQTIYDPTNTAVNITFVNLGFSGTGTKTFGNGGDSFIITGNLTIGSGSIVNTARNINFSGSTWTNSGTFNATASTVTFDGLVNQSINPGAINAFNAVVFNDADGATGGNTKSITGNGITVNGTLTFGDGTNAVINDFGTLTHTINGVVTVTANATWTTANSNFIFSGNASQNLPALTARNVQVTRTNAANYTKTLTADWTVDDLTIGSGITLDASATSFNITVRGNWTNNGTFTSRSATVFFESTSTTAMTITSGGLTSNAATNAFNNVSFNQTNTSVRNYTLLSPSTSFNGNLVIGNGANLDLNGTILILGNNDTPDATETHTVQSGGTLDIDANASLRFENTDGQSTLTVANGGTLKILGSDAVNIATISRSAGVSRTAITVNGNIEARYYLIEYLADAGLNVTSSATVHATNNFSDGSWSNINTGVGANRTYLQLDANTGAIGINNVTFNFAGSPTAGIHFNVGRANTATGVVTFGGVIDGTLAGLNATTNSTYEADPVGSSAGLLDWPISTAKTWTGATDDDWNVSTNWNPVGVPDNTYDVTIPTASNYPKVKNANASCKSLTLTTGQLAVQGGYDLTVSSDVTIGTANNIATLAVTSTTSDIFVGGAWTRGTNGIFSNGSSTVIFNASSGTKTVNMAGTSYPFYNITFTGGATYSLIGNSNYQGSITIDPSTTLNMGTNGYSLNVSGNIIVNGTFNPNPSGVTGTITLNGTSQGITNGVFSTLVASGSGTKTFTGNLTVNSALTISSGVVFRANDASSSMTVNGNFTCNGGTFNDRGASHFVTGNWTNTGTYTAGGGGTGSVTFSGGAQTINAATFQNLILGGTTNSTKTLAGNLIVNGDLTVNATNSLNQVNFTITGQPTKAFTFNGTTLTLAGADNYPSGFGTNTMVSTSGTTFSYSGGTQTIRGGITYGSITLTNAVTKVLSGDITVAGALNIGVSTLDVSTNNYTIYVGGTWTNNSTGSFVARLGEVVFNGSATQNITNDANASPNYFYKLTISGTLVQAVTSGLTITNNLQVTQGSFTLNGTTSYVGGNIVVSGTGAIANSGTLTLNATNSPQDLYMNSSTLANVVVNAPGVTYIVQDQFTTVGGFTLTAGTFNGNSKVVSLGDGNGSDAVSITGTYIIGAGGYLKLGSSANLTVNVGGELQAIGTSGSVTYVTRSTVNGNYGFTVNGTIRARYALFEYMNTSGIKVTTSATIDATNNFSDCTFTNGLAGGSATLLKIEVATAGMTINNVSFPTNPGGGASNVTRNEALSGIIQFNAASGAFSGESFDQDPNSFISWPTPVTLTWNGSVSTDWATASNWTPSSGPTIVPDATTNVIIATATNQPIITVSGALANNLTINNGATLTINTADDGTANDLSVSGDLTITGTLTISSSVDIISAAGNWTKGGTGTFNNGGSTVRYEVASGSKTLNNGTANFYNLTINSVGSVNLGASTTVTNDLTISAGTFDISNNAYVLTIGKNFSNSSVFTSRQGTVVFNQSGALSTITAGSSSFYNITFNGGTSTEFRLLSDLTTAGNITISSGIVNLNGFILNNGDGTGVDALSITGTLTVNANASLKMGANSTLTVNNTGRIRVVGTSSSAIATVTRQTAGTYSFTVDVGGTIEATYYSFEYMGTSGIQINSGGFIDATNDFDEGTFSNGAAGGVYLNFLGEFSDATNHTFGSNPVSNVTFNSGPTYNVRRTSGTNLIEFRDAAGSLAGFLYEDDNTSAAAGTGAIRWSNSGTTFTWVGGVSTDWGNVNNWNDGSGVPADWPKSTHVDIANLVITIPSGTTFSPVIDAADDAAARNLTINNGATLTLSGAAPTLTVSNSLSNAGTLTAAGATTAVITVGNTFTNTSVFTPGASSTVILTAASGTKTLANGGSSFYNLTISGGATFNLSGALTVSNNLSISAGTVDLTTNNYGLNVGGNLDITGTGVLTTRSGIITMNGTGSKTLNPRTSTFYSLVVNKTGGGTVTLTTNDLTLNGNLTLTAGTFAVGSQNINILGTWTNSAATFNAGTGTVTFNGSGNFNMTTNSQSFNNLVLNKNSVSNIITLNSNLTLTGALTITTGTLFVNGKIVTSGDGNSDNVSVGASGVLSVDAGAQMKFYPGTTNSISGTLSSVGSSLANRALISNVSAGTYILNIANGGNFTNGFSTVQSAVINVSGTLTTNSNSDLRFSDGTVVTVNSGGTFTAVGASTSALATVTSENGSSHYQVDVLSGGTLNARNALFSFTGIGGGYGYRVRSGATINATNRLNGVQFSNGIGLAYLRLENNQTLQFDNMNFTSGPTYNISANTGTYIVNNYKGAFSGARFEDDVTGIGGRGFVRWIFDETQTISGTGSYTFGNDFIINVTTAGTGFTSARVVLTDNIVDPNYPVSMARYYSVTTNGSGYVANITQFWGVYDQNGQTIDNTLRHWRKVGSVLTPFLTDASPTAYSATRTGLSYAVDGPLSGDWFISNAATEGSLPVELDEKSIELTAQRTGIEFKWATQSELNNRFWEVERSEKGTNEFTVVGKLDGKGTTSEKTNYRFVDKSAEIAKTYLYRLVDYDFAGNKFTHDAHEIEFVQPKEFVLFNNYPNPFNPTTTIPVDIAKEQQVSLIIYNILGQQVRILKNEVMKPGYYNLQWDGKDSAGKSVASGQYFVRVVTEGFVKTQKMMLMK